MTRTFRKLVLVAVLGPAVLAMTACDPTYSGGGSIYYDSLLWNDYYYGYPRPPRPDRPNPPDRPHPPVRPEHPIARPPVARPPVARPPIHRPPVARPMPARLR
ncbi:MAG: hypothetical protein AB3N21_10860 [Ruegeria sp.]|uniref:hypothetical protein n=1 Tax=Ruegeria sp. TaxID=1879320 RepID=UPI00349E69EE